MKAKQFAPREVRSKLLCLHREYRFGAYNLEIGFLRGFFKKSQFSFLFLPKLLKYPVDFVRNWTKSSYPLKKPKNVPKTTKKLAFCEKAAKSQFVTRKQAGGRRRTELPAQSRPPGATHTELPAQSHPPGAACNAGQSFIYTIFVVQSSTFQTSVTKSS